MRNKNKITIKEIKIQSPPHKGILAKFEDPIAYRLAYIFLKLNFSANQVSFLIMVLCICGSLLFVFRDIYLNLIAIFLFMVADNLDYVDGIVARFQKKYSGRGVLFDLIHHILERSTFFIGTGFYFYGKENIYFYLSIALSLISLMILSFKYRVMVQIGREEINKKFGQFPFVLIFGGFTVLLKFGYFFAFLIGLLEPLIILLLFWQIIRLIVVPVYVILNVE